MSKTEAESQIDHAMSIGPKPETFAEGWFAASMSNMLYEDAFYAFIGELLGDSTWKRISADYYDSSFELHECADDLAFMPEHLERFWSMGFQRCWINHNDGTETYYWKGGNAAGHRKKSVRSA